MPTVVLKLFAGHGTELNMVIVFTDLIYN